MPNFTKNLYLRYISPASIHFVRRTTKTKNSLLADVQKRHLPHSGSRPIRAKHDQNKKPAFWLVFCFEAR
jgi:hypothetical protein